MPSATLSPTNKRDHPSQSALLPDISILQIPVHQAQHLGATRSRSVKSSTPTSTDIERYTDSRGMDAFRRFRRHWTGPEERDEGKLRSVPRMSPRYDE